MPRRCSLLARALLLAACDPPAPTAPTAVTLVVSVPDAPPAAPQVASAPSSEPSPPSSPAEPPAETEGALMESTRSMFGALDVPPPRAWAEIARAAPRADVQLARFPCPAGATASVVHGTRFSGWWSLGCKDADGRPQGRWAMYIDRTFRRYDFYVDGKLRKFVSSQHPDGRTCVRWFRTADAGSGHEIIRQFVYRADGTVDAAGWCGP